MKTLIEVINEKLKIRVSKSTKVTYIKNEDELLEHIEKTNDFKNGILDLQNLSFENFETLMFRVNDVLQKVHSKHIIHTINVSGWVFPDKKDFTLVNIFSELGSIKQIIGLYTWDMSNVVNIAGMFNGCINLTELDDISNWDLRNCDNFARVFRDCAALRKLDLTGWNPSSIKTLELMFKGCKELNEIKGIETWPIENVKYFNKMFFDCSNITKLDLSKWVIGKACDSTVSMFANCENLQTVGDISGWKTLHIHNLESMFYNCKSLNCDISNWTFMRGCYKTKMCMKTNSKIFKKPSR